MWAADITYIPIARGFLYLVVIMDWHSRCVLAWRLSNTLDSAFCVDALEESLSRGTPKIFNTDQGTQFTGEAFAGLLKEQGIQISHDGKGRYLDNIFARIPHLAQTSDAVNRQLPCFSSRCMNLLAVFQI